MSAGIVGRRRPGASCRRRHLLARDEPAAVWRVEPHAGAAVEAERAAVLRRFGGLLQRGDYLASAAALDDEELGRTNFILGNFQTPSPPCPHLDLIYTIKFMQPPLLRPLFHDIISGSSFTLNVVVSVQIRQCHTPAQAKH